jgi:hemerythrin-like domain-containing protein
VSSAGPGVDTHEMVLIHRVIRREVGQLPRLISAANDRARFKTIGAHAREMLDFLHPHHTGEDELRFPLLRERVTLDPELIDRMDAQHAQVDATVAAVGAELPACTTSADAAASERVATRIDATMPTLILHLAEEEQKLLPMVSVTLTQSEWDALGKHGMSAIPITRRLVMLGHNHGGSRRRGTAPLTGVPDRRARLTPRQRPLAAPRCHRCCRRRRASTRSPSMPSRRRSRCAARV